MKKKVILMGCTAITILFSIVGCGNDAKEEQGERLKNAYEKELNGEPMSEEEYNTLKSFHEWEDKQTEKTYDEWK